MSSRITWCGKTLDQGISPNISINKEILRTDEGDSLAQKFAITVDGYVVAKGDPVTGARQTSIYQQINSFLGISPTGTVNQQGRLEIIPVDGGSSSGVLLFDNAQLISLDLPEAPEDTAGIQFQQYSFTFESYQPVNSFDVFSAYRIKSVNEDWEIQRQDDGISYANDDLESASKYTYTLTHTLSAVGIQKYENGQLVSPAWNEAYKFVNSRLVENPTSISGSIYGQKYGTSVDSFNLKEWKTTTGNVTVADLVGYNVYNRVRTSSVDLAGGSYSATTTYQLSPSSGTYEVNVKYDEGEEGDVTISIDGTVTPLSTSSTTSSSHTKKDIAKFLFNKISDNGNWTKFKTIADNTLVYYKGYGSSCSGALSIDQYPRGVSVGQNRSNGQITFNLTYKGLSSDITSLKQRIPGAIAVSMMVTEDNPLVTAYKSAFQFNKVAVIDILGKSDGPVIQDMGTTKERKRTVQLDVTMKQGCRKENSSPASSCYPIVSAKRPAGDNVYSQNFTESWDWINGKYNLSVDWIYT